MGRTLLVGTLVGILSAGVFALEPRVPDRQAAAQAAAARPIPQTVEQLVGFYCAEMWAARTGEELDVLAGIVADITSHAMAFAQSSISAKDTLQARYDALNATIDKFQAEREFLMASAPARARRGGMTSLVEQRLSEAGTKYQEGIGIEQRIRRLDGQILDARDLTGVGAASDTRRLRDDHLSRRALDFLRTRFTGKDAGGVDASGRTGQELQTELALVHASVVPAFGASISGLLGRAPGPGLPAMLAALEAEVATLTRQLAAEGAADDAARAARLAEIDASITGLDDERRTLLTMSDEVMRAGRRARVERVTWELAAQRVGECARDQAQWLLSQSIAAPYGAQPGAGTTLSWAGQLSGAWTSSCTFRGEPLGTPAGRFTLTIDARGSITGAFVEGATSSISGRVDGAGQLVADGSYVMNGTRLSIALHGVATRSQAGGISARGTFTSADGDGVACSGQWEGGR